MGQRFQAPVSGWLGEIWNFELFSVTETTQIDGRVVTPEYGVTVGKSIGVLVLFGLGYWASGYMSRKLIDLVARRLHLSPPWRACCAAGSARCSSWWC